MDDYGSYSDYLISKWLDSIKSGYLALHYDNPEVAGAYASEVFGGSYGRLGYVMTQPTNKGMLLASSLLFNGLPAMKVLYVAGWDAPTNGNYLWSAPLPGGGHSVLEGKSLSIPANTIGLSLA